MIIAVLFLFCNRFLLFFLKKMKKLLVLNQQFSFYYCFNRRCLETPIRLIALFSAIFARSTSLLEQFLF